MCMSNVCQWNYFMFEIDDFPCFSYVYFAMPVEIQFWPFLVNFDLDLNPNLFPFLSIMTMMSLMDSSSPKTHKMRYYRYSCLWKCNFGIFFVKFDLGIDPNLFPFLSIMKIISLIDSSSPKTHKMRHFSYEYVKNWYFQSSTGGHLGLVIFRVFDPDTEFGTYHMLFLGLKSTYNSWDILWKMKCIQIGPRS